MEKIIIKGWNKELTYALNIQKQLGEVMYDKYSISHNHYLIMAEIANYPMITQYRLSKVLHLTKQRINQLVKSLLEEEYVTLKVEEGGRKRKMLEITSKGTEVLIDIDAGKLNLIKELVNEGDVEFIIETFERLEKINKTIAARAFEKGMFNNKQI